MRGVVESEEKLAVVGARGVFVRHRHLSPMIEFDPSVYFIPEGLAVDALPSFPRPGGVPALNHELPDHAMEHGVIVVLR